MVPIQSIWQILAFLYEFRALENKTKQKQNKQNQNVEKPQKLSDWNAD